MLNRKASEFLLVFLIVSAMLSFTLQFANAQEEDQTAIIGNQALIINKDWVDTTAIEFDGHSFDYGGKFNRLTVEHGAHGMTNYINHGEVAYDKVTDTHVYMAEMIYTHSYLIYTDCMIDDVYPSHYTGTSNKKWLTLTTFKNYAEYCLGWEKGNTQEYYISYKNIHADTIDSQEYDGNLRIMMSVTPDLPIQEGDIIYVDGIPFKVPDIRIFLSQVKVIDRTYGIVDPDTKNFYTENEGVEEYRKEDLSDLTSSSHSSEAKDQIGDSALDRDEKNMGWTPKEVISWARDHNWERYSGVTYTSGQIGQGFATGPTPGATWSRSEDLSDLDEEFIYDVPVRIKPNIFYDLEKFDVNYAQMKVDTYKEGWPYTEYGLCELKNMKTDEYSRIVGLGVQNIYVRIDFETSVTVLMGIQPISQEGQDILEDPEFYESDIIWDNAVGGTTDAEVAISEGPRTWADDWTDAWNDFWTDTGKWWNDQIEWWKDGIEDAWDNWYDWWDNLPSVLSDWWKQYWWIIVLLGLGAVLILGVIFFWRRIATGTARGVVEYQQGRIENERKPT